MSEVRVRCQARIRRRTVKTLGFWMIALFVLTVIVMFWSAHMVGQSLLRALGASL